MPRVGSTMLWSLDYRDDTKLLTVIFLDKKKTGPGSQYDYHEVPRSIYDAIMNRVDSHGMAFNELVRGKFEATKIS